MTDSRDESLTTGDEALEKLLHDVGSRPEPTPEATRRAYDVLKSDWSEQVVQRKKVQRHRWQLVSSAAAVVLVTLLVTTMWPADRSTIRVQLAEGSLTLDEISYSKAQVLEIEAGMVLLATTPVRLSTSAGADLRLVANSHLQWMSDNKVYLNAGSAYVDTEGQISFGIDTPYGQVRDIGTRYMVALDDQVLTVAVREGAAEIHSQFGLTTAIAEPHGSAVVHIDRSGAQESIEPTSNNRWDWIHEVAPGYAEQAVPVVLALIGRDLGKQIQFKSRGVEATVAYDSVQGELRGLPPRQALELVARSAQLDWVEDQRSITLDFIR